MKLPVTIQQTFEPDLLQEIEAYAKFQTIPVGETIIRIGQTIRVIPIILNGIVKISRLDDEGSEILMYYVNPMESCAMTFTCCMQHKASEIEAIAEDEVELIAIPVTFMDKWLSQYSTWKNVVMNTIQSRFEEMLTTIDQLAFQKLDDRLVHYLKEKSRVTNSTLINLSHEQIAQELATSRVVISRLLKKLENDKKLLLYRNQIKLLNAL